MKLVRNTITAILGAVFTVPLITGAATAPPENSDFTVDKQLIEEVIENHETIGSAKYGDGEFASIYLEKVDYDTRIVEDTKLPKGVEVVTTPGEPGRIHHFIVDDEKIYSVSKEKPTEEVIRKGTRENNEAPAIAPELIERWEQEEAERKAEEQERKERERAEQEAREQAERAEQEAEAEAEVTEPAVSNGSSGNSNSSASSSTSSNSSGLGSPSDGCGGWKHLIDKHFGSESPKACSVLMCESQGNPKAQNPVSTASGGFQFVDGTWRSVRSYANASEHARAKDATPQQQTIAAKRLRDTAGWGQWVCQ